MSASRADQLEAELNRREALEGELSKRQSSQSIQPGSLQKWANSPPTGVSPQDLNRTPTDVIRDLGAGLARGSQNLASGLLEGGEYITRKGAERLGRDLGNPVKVPYWNAREFMGLEGNNPIDLGGKIQSQNPDPLTMGIGQYGPGALMGGATLPGQVASNALYGMSQASPQQQNAFGLLPSGRPGAAIEGGALGAAPFAFSKMVSSARNALNKYFSPEKTTKNFISDLSQGKTIPENVQEISKRLSYGQKAAKEEALTPKREVMENFGEQRTFPSQIRDKKLLEDATSIFGENISDISKTELASFRKSLKDYYKDGDIEKVIEKGEDIFNHPGLSDKGISSLEQLLIPEKPVMGEYLKMKNPDSHYSNQELLREAHNDYVKNPTFANSDKLRSRLFKRINELKKRQDAKTITDSQEVELRGLTKNRNAIIKDQNDLIEKLPPKYQEKYGEFNKLWREDVRAYEDAGTTIKNLKNGHLKNVTPQKITEAFSFPELKPELQKIMKDIGPSGVNNIIYNEIGRTTNAKEALQALENLERNKGFSPYITNETRAFMNDLRKQIKNKSILKWGGGVLAGSAGAGAAYELGKRAIP